MATTFDLISDIARAQSKSSSCYTGRRNSLDSHHIYDYVDETARPVAMAIPEIVFTVTDSDSEKDRQKRSKNRSKNSRSKFSLHRRNKAKGNKPGKNVKTVAGQVDMDYDTVLQRFKRQMLDQKRRSSLEQLQKVGKVSAMVNMFERHATYMATAGLVRCHSEPRLSTSGNLQSTSHAIKRQNSYVEPVSIVRTAHSSTDLSSSYTSSSDEKQKTRVKRPMRIRNMNLKSSSEGTDSDSSKQCGYLEVIRTPRPSSIETEITRTPRPSYTEVPYAPPRYENEFLPPAPPVPHPYRL